MGWQNPKVWQHQMVARMWTSRNLHSLMVGMQNGTATLEDILVVSYKTKYTLTIWSSNHVPWYLSKGIENLCLQKNLQHGCFIFIHNHQNLGATKVSFSLWMNKQTVVHPDNGILFSNEKRWTINPWRDMEES